MNYCYERTLKFSVVTRSITCPSQTHNMREHTACVDFIHVKKKKKKTEQNLTV